MNNTPGAGDKRPNWPAVAMRALDIGYELIRTGNIVALLVLSVVILIFVVLIRIPEEQLSWLLHSIGNALASSHYTPILLAASLAICSIVFWTMQRTYRREIQRLVDMRKVLMHGLESGTLKPLKKHTSTGIDLGEEDDE